MPLTRYQIRNEYGLADMELYGAADKDDPEALLEGVAMAGLVGVLRQLGDLADFAAEIFHCLHEELMVTAARGQGLVVRVQQLEAGVPLIEKAALSQSYLSAFFSHPGSDWHPILQTENNLIAHRELPHCMADSYEECRDPPRLFLLDKFDVAGAGACLKRYSDPSLFKTQRAPSGIAASEVGKAKKTQRPMKKGSHWTNGETPQLVPTSHAKLHQLFSMEHVDSGYRDPVFHVKLKRRQLNEVPVNPSSGRSYMEKFLQNPSTECEKLPGFYSKPRVSTLGNEDSCESEAKVTEISAAKETEARVCNVQEVFSTPMPCSECRDTVKDIKIEPEPDADVEAVKMPSTPQKRMTKEKPLANLEGGPTSCLNVTFSGDLTTRVGDCTDALASMELKTTETDNEYSLRMESKTTKTDNEYSLRNGLGFLGVKPQIYSDADGNQEEVHSIGHTSMLDAVHHSFEEAGSDVLYTDVPGPSPKARPPNVEGSAETVDISCSQSSVNADSLWTGTSELVSLSGLGAAKDIICKLEGTPFCLSSSENFPHLLQDPATSMQFGSEKLHANEIGMKFSETSAISGVHSDSEDTVDASFEAQPVHLPKLPCVVPEAEGSTDEVLQTNYADHCETENISNMGTESAISFSVLMGKPFSGLTSQETEVRPGTSLFLGGTESVKSEDISSEADASISAAEIKSESVMHEEVESEKILLAGDGGTISFEDLSPVATLAGNSFPEEDVINLENLSSMDVKTGNLVSPFNFSSGNGTVAAYTPQNSQTGSERLSASSHNDPLVDRDLDVMAHYHEQEDLQPVSIVSDDNKHGELLARDNDVKDGIGTLKYHASISEDACQNNQTGQDNIDSETMYEGESRKSDVDMFCIHPYSVCSPRESLTGVQKSLLQHQRDAEQNDALSSECCLRSEDQEQQHPSKTAAVVLNPCDISVQELFFDLEDSSPEEPESGISRQGHLESETESLLQNNHLQGSENTFPSVASYPQGYESGQLPKLKDLYTEHLPAHKESSISLTLNDCSEPMLSADHTDEMPPPPPLPPLQWCTGKPQATARSASNESVGTSTVDLTAAQEDSWVPLGENALEASSTTGFSLPAVKHVAVDQSAPGTGFEGEAIDHVQQNLGKIFDPPPKDVLTSSAAGKTLPVNIFSPSRTLGDENSHENPTTRKLSRPEVLLGDAVPAIDRSMLRKISERVRPPGEPKVDEKDSLLEVIRNKSFSLKPAVTSARPNIQMAPQTNVKVAAILEKANTLRQAMAGSDDDDDSDSWSDT